MALRRGCCGCDLRTASSAIGITFLVMNCIGLLSIIIQWVRFSNVKQSLQSTTDLPAESLALLATVERIYIPQTVFTILSLLFNALLIHGAKRSSARPVLAWLIYYGIGFVIFTLTSIGLLIACGVVHAQSAKLQQALEENITQPGTADVIRSGGFALAVALGVAGACGLLISPLLWYWYAVVLAFYRELGGYAVRGTAERGQGSEEGNVGMVAL